MPQPTTKNAGDSAIQLGDLLDQLPECLVVLDRKGAIHYLNAAWERTFGDETISSAGLKLGASYIRCHEVIFQSDESQKLALATGISAIMQGKHQRFDQQHLYQAGDDRRYFVANLLPYTVAGETGALLQLRDITEQKRAEEALRQGEERFRQLAENIREVFWMTDPRKNSMIYVSPAYEQVWGRSCESLYERPISFIEAIHDEDRERIFAAMAKQVEGTYDEEYRVVRPDESVRWIRDRAFPVRNDDGEVYRVVGIAEDISERKEAEQALRNSTMQEETIRAQAEVLAELSTPLFPVSDHIVVMPLIGTLDTQRTQRVMDSLLRGVETHRAQVAILDITGVPLVDTQVADTLMRAAQAIRLLGAEAIITGIRPEVAQTLVGLGLNLNSMTTHGSLQSGIAYALEHLHSSAHTVAQNGH